MSILITGAAGFIGSTLAGELINQGQKVIGTDNLNDYYSQDLKNYRLGLLLKNKNFTFHAGDLSNLTDAREIINIHKPQTIFHLAAQAGVRIPIEKYNSYTSSNLVGFANIATSAVAENVPNFIYASSSSVYGDSTNFPYSESETGLSQLSYYGATKYSNEILATTLALNSTTRFRGLRFFTVYGPAGRPDMAYFKLIAAAILRKPFHLYGDGSLKRDFTYIGDVVRSCVMLESQLRNNPAPFSDIVNVGGGKPSSISDLIEVINSFSDQSVEIIPAEKAIGDVKETKADTSYQLQLTNFKPEVSLKKGIELTFQWANENDIAKKLEEWTSL